MLEKNHSFYDQPHIIYISFKYKLYNNKILKSFVVNNDNNVNSDKILHHFPGGPGVYEHKIILMNNFLKNIKDFTITKIINATKMYINCYLLPTIKKSKEMLEGNVFMKHHTTTFNDEFLNKTKNICNVLLNKNIINVIDIGFNSGFSTLLMLLTNPNIFVTCFDMPAGMGCCTYFFQLNQLEQTNLYSN